MKCFARLFRDAARTMRPTDTIESLTAELIVAKGGQNLLEESIIARACLQFIPDAYVPRLVRGIQTI